MKSQINIQSSRLQTASATWVQAIADLEFLPTQCVEKVFAAID